MGDSCNAPSAEEFEKIRALVNELWESERSDFYRVFWSTRGFDPAVLKTPKDFLRVPLLRKKDLIEAQNEGLEKLLFLQELAQYIRTTSGTTSKAEENMLLTFQNDEYKAVLTVGEFSVLSLAKRLLLIERAEGMVRDTTIAVRAGAMPVLGDAFDLSRSAYIAQKARVDGILTITPQLIPPLIEILETKYGYPRQNIKTVIFITASWKELAALRALLPHAYILSGQGMSEYGITFGYACERIAMLDFREEPIRYHVRKTSFLEIVDPESGSPLPDGTRGEIVITPLVKAPTPLIRYATGDEGYIFAGETCSCGRAGPLFRLTRRLKSDFAWVGGLSLWADDFAAAVESFPQLLEPVFRAHISEEVIGTAVKPKIALELVPKMQGVSAPIMAERLAQKIAITGRHNLANVIAAGLCLPLEVRFVERLDESQPRLTSDVEY